MNLSPEKKEDNYMYSKQKLLFMGIAVSVLFFILVFLRNNHTKTQEYCTTKNPCHEVEIIDKELVNKGIAKAQTAKVDLPHAISGGIVPHHIYPSFIIADFYRRLSVQKPETIILLAPNHFEKGDYKVLSSLYDWKTAFGVVESSKQDIRILLENNVLEIDEDVVGADFSITTSLPFIKYYMPNANVVPVLLSGRMNKQEAEVLADNIGKIISDGVVVVASVDFSHYLVSKEAQKRDKVTLDVMQNFDYRRLFSLNNDYLDSPPSIGVLLMLMQKLKKTNMDIFYHTNSGELENDGGIQTTSYFSLSFY